MQMRVKILCNHLWHSALCVKAKGWDFRPLPLPSAPPWRGTFCAAVFVVPPTVLRALRGEDSCLHP